MLYIRRVQPDDIFPVIALAFETLPERYNPSIFTQFYESCPEGFFVALSDDSIIGFLIGIRTLPHVARILMLAVRKDYRRQKIGSSLLSSFIEGMKQHKVVRVELEVRTSNRNALMFYQAQGFQVQATLHQFYQNKENAYSMHKEL